MVLMFFFFFNDTATTEIYTLSLHDALPILGSLQEGDKQEKHTKAHNDTTDPQQSRSEERFSRNAETDLVCRLLLEKKKKYNSSTCSTKTKDRVLVLLCAATPLRCWIIRHSS